MVSMFTHSMPHFNIVSMLNRLGIHQSNPLYIKIAIDADILIRAILQTSAVILNKKLISEYRTAMLSIREYANFPRYISVMEQVLSRQEHREVFTRRGIYQVKFIDSTKIGDETTLHGIQKQVYPAGGTLRGWKALYISWEKGESTKYADTVNRRLDIMVSQGSAPFLTLIDNGNGTNSYPSNPYPTNVLLNFRYEYKKEMTRAYYTALQALQRQVTQGKIVNYSKMSGTTVNNNGVILRGFEWKSAKGNTVFMTSGTERLANGKFRASGFMLNNKGSILRRWSGWIPK